MNESIYLCYKRTMTSVIAASIVFEKLRNNGFSVFYTRKLRENDFIKNINKIIEPVQDVIVLLDEHSFLAIEEGKEKFLESWFCRELLEGINQNKNIIVICLNGYSLPEKTKMPVEIHSLYDCQRKTLDTYNLNISENINEFVGNLKSKPKLRYLVENNVSFENSSDFLIYSDGDCNVYEYGYLIATIDSNVDKHHPFKYTVNRSGEHCFYAINHDSGQTQELSFTISPGFQKYVHIQWEPSKALSSIKNDDIVKESDAALLYNWGKSFFFGNPKLTPDYEKALLCFKRSAELGYYKALEFIRKYDHSLASIYKVPKDIAERWYKEAAEKGSPEAWMKMGEKKEEQDDLQGARRCYIKALELGHISAESAISRLDCIKPNIRTEKDRFLIDFHNIVENFRRQIGSGRIGKYNREVKFKDIVNNLSKMEEILRNPNNAKVTSIFLSESSQSKFHNRMFGLLGYLAQKNIFKDLKHKDILEICLDENGENQSAIKEFKTHMGGESNLKDSNIAKIASRMITKRVKSLLDSLTNEAFLR